MPKVPIKQLTPIFFLLLFFQLFSGKAQEGNTTTIDLISYIGQLEKSFNVKFSYVDEDIQSTTINIPENQSLQEILLDIQNQAQITIKKLSERYYTISKNSLVDLCAVILDNFGNNTISGASVELLGTDVGTITDKDGKFSLTDIPRKAIIRIKHLGFKTKYISARELTNQNPCNTVLLAEKYQQLDEVVVYKFLTRGLVKNPDASIQLNTDDFGILPGLIEPDILQTVQALPGIESIDETVSDINVRGGTNDQNLILWDGIKMYQSGHFFGLISAFNPYLTDKITLIKNGTSAQYGDGISSVINMETKNSISDSFYGGAGFNLISGDVFGHLPITDKLAVQFSARRSETDFLKTPTYNRFFDKAFQDSEVEENQGQAENSNIQKNADFYFYDFSGKVLYNINGSQKARFSFININNNLNYTEISDDQHNKSTLVQTNLSFGGKLESTWSSRFSTSLNMYYTRYNLDAQNLSGDAQQQLLQNNKVLETALKLNSNYKLSENINWLNGYQLTETGITNRTRVTQPPYTSNITDVIRAHSLFSEVNYTSPDRKINIRLGGRLNYIHNLESPTTKISFTKWIPEPRINMNFLLVKHFKASLLGEFKSQTTNQIIDLEQNFLGIEKRRWILSNDSTLPITKSKQASVGFTFDKKKLHISVEGFYKKVDGISTATQGFQNQDQFNGEIGGYNIKGVEFLINKKTTKYSTWLSYTYNDNNYTFNGITPNHFPNNLDIRHTLTLAGTYVYKKLKLGLGINYRTGKPYTKPQEGNNALNLAVFPNRINYEEPNSSRLPDYLRADASVIYNFNMSERVKASVGASVLNLMDKKNILNTYYRLNEDNAIETVQRTSLGITPNFSFRIKF